MVVPPNHAFLDGMFPHKNHPAIGVPHVWKTLYPNILGLRDESLSFVGPRWFQEDWETSQATLKMRHGKMMETMQSFP